MTIPGIRFSPVSASLIERLLGRADRALTLIEREQLRRITAEYLMPIRGSILSELQRRYPNALADVEGKSDAWRLARGRLLAAELSAVADATLPESVQQGLRSAVGQTALSGLEEALQLLDTFESGLARQLVDSLAVNYQAVNNLAVTMGSHLHRYGEDFIQKAQGSVIESLVRGEGVRKAGARLRRAHAQTTYNAERIVRTEFHQAHDLAVRTSYEASGIEYVQRIATMDDRVCGYCAARAGQVYRVEEAPASLHPHDRCYNLPWRPEWEENGVIDKKWIKDHRAETVQRLKDAGGDLHTGRAPFERMNDLPKPRTAWHPLHPGKFTPLVPVVPPLSQQFPLVVNLARPVAVQVSAPAPTPPAPVATPAPVNTETQQLSRVVQQFRGLRGKDAADAFADSPYYSTLSQSDKDLLLKYQSFQYDELNAYLRGETTRLVNWSYDEIERLIELASIQVPDDVVTYRFFTLPDARVPKDPSKLVGTVIENPHFVSTSLREAFPTIIGDDITEGATGIIAEIRVPRGASGIYADIDFKWLKEDDWIEALVDGTGSMHELILPPGSDFRIVSAQRGPDGLLKIVVDVIQDRN